MPGAGQAAEIDALLQLNFVPCCCCSAPEDVCTVVRPKKDKAYSRITRIPKEFSFISEEWGRRGHQGQLCSAGRRPAGDPGERACLV